MKTSQAVELFRMESNRLDAPLLWEAAHVIEHAVDYWRKAYSEVNAENVILKSRLVVQDLQKHNPAEGIESQG